MRTESEDHTELQWDCEGNNEFERRRLGLSPFLRNGLESWISWILWELRWMLSSEYRAMNITV